MSCSICLTELKKSGFDIIGYVYLGQRQAKKLRDV